MLSNTKSREGKKVKGFTLLELLVVIGIIGILVSIGSVAFTAAQARSRDTKRRGDLDALSKALEQYNAENNGQYPASASCSGLEDYLAGTVPVDPKYGFEYTSVDNTMSGGTGDYCSVSAYCICVELEAAGTGNAYVGRSATTCAFTGTDKDYYCVRNLQ